MTACARPIGDFGRAEPGILHDEIMPATGKLRARASDEPVSKFNPTDQETEMHDRVWRYLIAPNVGDWFFDIASELRRTRLVPAEKFRFRPGRYYDWLKREKFASSRTRYGRVSDDVTADIETMPETFRVICAVQGIDRQRAIAVEEIPGVEEAIHQEVRARKSENDLSIGWFSWSVRFRYDAYSYALDHLLIETPHEQALRLDALLSDLSVYVGAVAAGDFCSDPLAGHGKGGQDALMSRALLTDKEALLPPK